MQRFQRLRHSSREELEPLTWRQVRKMIAVGMECGAHTHTHPNLLFLKKPQLVYEIKQVQAYIEDKIGQRVDGFAYPFGKPHCHFNRVHIDMAQEAGYKYAVAVFYRGILPRDSLWALPRISINDNENVKILADKIEGAWDWLGHFHEWSPRWLGRMIAPKSFRVTIYGFQSRLPDSPDTDNSNPKPLSE